MKLVLVTDDPAIEAAVRLSAPEEALEAFALEGVTDARNVLSAHGRRVVEAAVQSDAVLVTFVFERAPVLNTLGYHIRRRQGPPLVGLYVGGPEERVGALAAGADDAVGLPLHLALVQARALAHGRLVEAVRQHAASRPPGPAPTPDVVEVGPLKLDRNGRRFAVRGEEVTLTPREFALLDYLLVHAGQVRSRDEILDAVWGVAFDTGTNMVDVYVYFLRRKLEAFGVRGLIETVRGQGYRLVRPEKVAAGESGGTA